MNNTIKNLTILTLVLLNACGGVAQEEPETYGQCEIHVRKLQANQNGCWRITSRQGFTENGQYMCAAKPTCEVIPGDDQDYISGDVAWVGDVECSNVCKEQ